MRSSAPEVVATLDTFGGEGSWVTSDGFRYLFVDNVLKADDPVGLRIATDEGRALRAGGSLELLASAAPVMVAPGKFAVPHDSSVALVDASNGDQPSILWDVPIGSGAAGEVVNVTGVQRMNGGLVVLTQTTTPMQFSESVVTFLPLPDPTIAPLGSLILARSRLISDLDAQADVLTYATSQDVVWMRLDATGQVIESSMIPQAGVQRVTIEGEYVGLMGASSIVLYDVVPRTPLTCGDSGFCVDLEASCDGTFAFPSGRYARCSPNALTCPEGSHCETVYAGLASADFDCAQACCASAVDVCFSGEPPFAQFSTLPSDGVNDILINDSVLYRATDLGLRKTRIAGLGNNEPSDMLVDQMPAIGLEHSTDAVFVSGKAALALKTNERNLSRRIEGPGLGEITAITDKDATHLLLGGPMAVGEIDLGTNSFSSWATTAQAAGPALIRTLQGAHGTALIQPNPGDAGEYVGTCRPSYIQRFRAVDWIEQQSICDLRPTWLTLTSDRLWALPLGAPNPTAGSIVSWLLSTNAVMPDLAIFDGVNRSSLGLRSAEDGASLGLLQFDYTHGTSRLYSLDPATQMLVGEYGLEQDAGTHPANPTAYEVDGPVALTVSHDAVRLHPRLAIGETPPVPAVALPSLSLIGAFSTPLPRVVGMAKGTAWVAWKQGLANSTRLVLSEVHYDAQGTTLEGVGNVNAKGMVTSVYTAGEYTVAATNSAVMIVAPGCGHAHPTPAH
jgi:hypothetical protein